MVELTLADSRTSAPAFSPRLALIALRVSLMSWSDIDCAPIVIVLCRALSAALLSITGCVGYGKLEAFEYVKRARTDQRRRASDSRRRRHSVDEQAHDLWGRSQGQAPVSANESHVPENLKCS